MVAMLTTISIINVFFLGLREGSTPTGKTKLKKKKGKKSHTNSGQANIDTRLQSM